MLIIPETVVDTKSGIVYILFYYRSISKIIIHFTCPGWFFFQNIRKLKYFPNRNLLLDTETLNNYRVINTTSKYSCYIKGVVTMVKNMWVSLFVYFTLFSWNSADESKFYICLLFLQLI